VDLTRLRAAAPGIREPDNAEALRFRDTDDRGVGGCDLAVRKGGCDREAVGEGDVAVAAVIVAGAKHRGSLSKLTRRLDRPGDLVEVPSDRLGGVIGRRTMNPDQDVEYLCDVHDRDRTLAPIQFFRDRRRGRIIGENADDRAGVEDYSP